MMKLVRFCAMIVALALLAAPGALAASVSVVANASTQVYRTASTSAASLTVSKGAGLTLTGVSGSWGRVTRKGITAYIPIKYLNLKKPVKAWLSKDTTVWREPGSDSLGTASKGASVSFLGVDGSYARVSAGGTTGYVSKSALTRVQPAPATATVSGGSTSDGASSGGSTGSSLLATAAGAKTSKVEKLIYTAQNLMGRPYSSNSNPPKSFDCATFVYYCYGKIKKGLVKSSAKTQGYDSRYPHVTSVSDLARGDLVCFDTVNDSDLSDHVGIYVGSGYFVHASSAAKKVIVSKLTSGYYKRVFSWGLRIL